MVPIITLTSDIRHSSQGIFGNCPYRNHETIRYHTLHVGTSICAQDVSHRVRIPSTITKHALCITRFTSPPLTTVGYIRRIMRRQLTLQPKPRSSSKKRATTTSAAKLLTVQTMSRLVASRKESKRQALIAGEEFDAKFEEQRLKYEAAAIVAAKASDSVLLSHQLASQQATVEASVQAKSKMDSMREQSKEAAVAASHASDRRFHDQKLQYEFAAVSAFEASRSFLGPEHSTSKQTSEFLKALSMNHMGSRKIISNTAKEDDFRLFHEAEALVAAATLATSAVKPSVLPYYQSPSRPTTVMSDVQVNSRLENKRNSNDTAMAVNESSDMRLHTQEVKHSMEVCRTPEIAFSSGGSAKLTISTDGDLQSISATLRS